ncbi:MAG: LysM peptidoglycan-binding domain-containing protein [Verrucomicrobiota bacterium]
MKNYCFLILFAAISAATVFGQDAAAQQQIDKLSGQIQDLLAAQGKQDQVIAGLRKEISELRDKVNTPQVNDSASREDLKTLAEKVQEIDKKRQADRDLIIKQIEQLGKVSAAPSVKPKPASKTPAPDETTAPATPQKGYEYVVKAGDTIGLIAKAYRDQGVKVTTERILKANPGLDATRLYVGKKVFIPDSNAK